MKNYLIGLFVLGFTSLGFSQTTKEIVLSDIDVTPINLTYLNEVQDKNTPLRAKKLENKAARFDITELPIFNKAFEAYEVAFHQTKGKIIATYDSNGRILSSFEKFDNITLPANVRDALLTAYPGWAIHKDMYLVSYYHNKEVKKTYKVQIRKDNLRRNLKMDIEGNFMK